MKHPLIFVLGVLLASEAAARDQGCLEYEPAAVEVRGTVSRKTYPGPPNYEDVKHGDAPETVWLLNLSVTACVTAKGGDPMSPRSSNVRQIQLVLEPAQYRGYAALVGKEVVASGQLFAAQTAHHHTDVLLTVRDLRAIGNR